MSNQEVETAIFSRFSGDRGNALIIDSLKNQRTILGNTEAAEELCARGTLICFPDGGNLTFQDDWSNGIIFILAGKVQIIISGFKVAERIAGQHVGEMALIDPAQPRSASAIAMEPTVGLLVGEEDFAAVATHHPDLWRQIAREISDRLRQRKKFIRPSNPIPLVFIACASESISVAEAIQEYFETHEIVAEIWTDGVFKPSQGTMESLEGKLSSADFTIAILSADDKVNSRGREQVAPRDNTIFELGLFAGAIGRKRSFFVIQKNADIKIPSDLAGITSLRFNMADSNGSGLDVAEACSLIKKRILELGPR